jgi:hypothetical protein
MSSNSSLIKLNLASNGLNDKGGQRFLDSLVYHHTIEEINLAQNGISNGSCFVVSQVLKGHPSLRKLDLSLNPLGEAGARSIFRTILRGLACFVMMRNCSYTEDRSIFNHTYPSIDNPYLLDLSEPYKRAIVQELMLKYLQDPLHCHFESLSYRENQKSSEIIFHLTIHNHQVCLKSTLEKWIVPKSGILKFVYYSEIFVPTLENRVDEKSFNILQIIIENGITEVDKRTWLSLLCQDVYVTTNQVREVVMSCFFGFDLFSLFIVKAQAMIDRFKSNRTIGTGGLCVLDILQRFDFLYLLL